MPVCKLDARVRDIDFVGDHRNADGFEVHDGRIHERKQNIEVVNHHVVHHVDIQAARRENAEAMDFEKHGARDDFLRRGDGGIESLDVADLQNAAGALRGGDQPSGFVERSGHRLFHQHVNAGIEQMAADARMFLGGNGDADGVDAGGSERVEIADNSRAEFGGDLARASALVSTMPTSSAPSSSRHTRM